MEEQIIERILELEKLWVKNTTMFFTVSDSTEILVH